MKRLESQGDRILLVEISVRGGARASGSHVFTFHSGHSLSATQQKQHQPQL
jgi:hypothetical protein